MKENKDKPSIWKSIRNGLFFALLIIAIAYSFNVIKIDLSEFRKDTRISMWTRALRALANPDLMEYDQEETPFNAPIYLPCLEGQTPQVVDVDLNQPYLVVPSCAALGEKIIVEGFNFPPGSTGPIGFVPATNLELLLIKGTVTADENGYFSFEFPLPNDRANTEVQYVRVVARLNVGSPHFTENASATWDKIVETVFMAFLATLIGMILSFPISFLAARNLMVNVKVPLTNLALTIIGWPVGIFLGGLLARWMQTLSGLGGENAWLHLGSVVVGGGVVWFLLRWALLNSGEDAGLVQRSLRVAALLFASLLLVFTIYELASLGMMVGQILLPKMGPFAFLANFLFQFSDITSTIMIVIVALITGGTVASFLGRIGQRLSEKIAPLPLRVLNALLAAMAFATLFVLIGKGIDWLYVVKNDFFVITLPGIVGVALGIMLALINQPKKSLPVGLVIYFITRTILNAVRSVEAVIMAIVFVIFVGIGPFAGVLALGLHTIASLAKLYSEQVESIMPGPLEAIEATGANRLQTIIYGVIPQIIPPYISYTMYRWDINVRMSTIIGITGGGGIGFLLFQNINLLNYRAASTQMFAIAIVVATMDYISSKLREKTV